MILPEVTFHDDGSATVQNVPGLYGEWRVFEQDAVWVARSDHGSYLKSRANRDFRATYRTRDEALQALGAHK